MASNPRGVAILPLAFGTCIGSGMGCSLGVAVHHLVAGVAIGAGIGMVLGSLLAFQRRR